MDRGAPDRAALKRAEELLKSGQIVVIFPEGQLSRDGELQSLLPGALMLALRARVPIIPIGIAGTNQVLPFSHVVPQPTLKKVHVHFGSPISFEDLERLPSREQRRIGAERLETALRAAIAVARAS